MNFPRREPRLEYKIDFKIQEQGLESSAEFPAGRWKLSFFLNPKLLNYGFVSKIEM